MCSADLVVREMFLGFKNPLMLGATKYNRSFVLCANDIETFLWLYKFMKMELENDSRRGRNVVHLYCPFL